MIKLNGTFINFKQFPNGETHFDGSVVHDNRSFFGQTDQILFKYQTDKDLIELLFLKRYLDDNDSKEVELILSYMPYSRMDRVEGFSVFTLKYISEFINSLNFSRVFIHEAHSDVTLALINRSMPLETTKELFKRATEKIEFDKEKDYVFYPDAGAQKRYAKMGDYNELVGHKKRNFETGRIESLNVIGNMAPGQKVIIVDDLSSYGGTFMLSAEKLKELGAGEIYLVVAHAEEAIFNGDIIDTQMIEKVYTTDSIITESHSSKVEVLMTVGWQEEETAK